MPRKKLTIGTMKSSHGGKREGAGRTPKAAREKLVLVKSYVLPVELKMLKARAKALGISIAAFIRQKVMG